MCYNDQMRGLRLSEEYFNKHGLPMLMNLFPEASGRIAAGLIGPGSECFGFDAETRIILNFQ